MPSEQEDERYKRIVSAGIARLYETLTRLPDQATLNKGARRRGRIAVSDVFVPLRSNLSLDVLIESGQLRNILVKTSGEQLAEIHRGSDTSALAIAPPLLEAFGTELLRACEQAVLGSAPSGIRLRPRPLIASPIWADGTKRDFASIHVTAALSAFSRVVLLGPPGSGKSTTLRAIAGTLLRGAIAPPKDTVDELDRYWSGAQLFPFLIELKDLVRWRGFPVDTKDDEDVTAEILEGYLLERYFQSDEYTYQYALDKLVTGSGVLLFDGLDEIPLAGGGDDALELRRAQMQSLMSSASSRYARSRIVVSSRPAGYSGWTIPGFEIVRPLPLDNREVEDLGRALYGAVHNKLADVERLAQNLASQVTRIPRELRGQPLFVALLANLLVRQPEAPLPTRRGDLLRESVELLLSSWSARRFGEKSLTAILGCSEAQLLERLSAIGFRATEQANISDDQEADISRGEILDELCELGPDVDLQKALNYISQHAGLLVSHVAKKYRFAHAQFREYLAALYVSKSADAADRVCLLYRDHPSRWVEVVLILADIFSSAGSVEKVWILIARLMRIGSPDAIATAAQVYLEQELGQPDVFAAVADDLRAASVDALGYQTPLSMERRRVVLDALSVAGDPRRGLGVLGGVPEIEWFEIPSGIARIGSSEEELRSIAGDDFDNWDFSREMPAHDLSVERFHIAKHPVTVAQFSAFVSDPRGYRNRAWWVGLVEPDEDLLPSPYSPSRRDENRPQTYVSWLDANAFCRWLSDRTGQSISLPTEVQWEYAARGPSARQFPWPDNLPCSPANVLENGTGFVVGVGAYENIPGPWGEEGPVDMIGNVWEWCSSAVELKSGSLFGYPYQADDGRENSPVSDTLFATRGGYYGSGRIMARCAFRGRDLAVSRLGRQGFRVVRTKPSG
jgi:formylglycine-generating enzyme required for sulfatase activity/energy-coupling factor transporter ATP-binding protein EcfA2